MEDGNRNLGMGFLSLDRILDRYTAADSAAVEGLGWIFIPWAYALNHHDRFDF